MSLFNHDHYKIFVQEMVKSLPSNGRGEWGRMAQAMGVNSTMVSQIFKGPKDLSAEQALDLAEYYSWNELETEYFITLVLHERAGTHRLKARLKQKLSKIKAQSLNLKDRVDIKTELSESDKAIFYSDWIFTACLMLTSIKEFQDIESLHKKLQVPRPVLNKVLHFLVSRGLCEHKDNRYIMLPHKSHLSSDALMVASHHKNWRQKAMEKAGSLSEKELMFSAPFSISKENFNALREKIVALVKEAGDLAESSSAETAGCINIDLMYI